MAAFLRAWGGGAGVVILLGALLAVALITRSACGRRPRSSSCCAAWARPTATSRASSSATRCVRPARRAARLRSRGAHHRWRCSTAAGGWSSPARSSSQLRPLDWILLACVPVVARSAGHGDRPDDGAAGADAEAAALASAAPAALPAGHVRAVLVAIAARRIRARRSRSPCSTSRSGSGPASGDRGPAAAAARAAQRMMAARAPVAARRAGPARDRRRPDLRGPRPRADPRDARGVRLQASVGLGDPGPPPPVRRPGDRAQARADADPAVRLVPAACRDDPDRPRGRRARAPRAGRRRPRRARARLLDRDLPGGHPRAASASAIPTTRASPRSTASSTARWCRSR